MIMQRIEALEALRRDTLRMAKALEGLEGAVRGLRARVEEGLSALGEGVEDMQHAEAQMHSPGPDMRELRARCPGRWA